MSLEAQIPLPFEPDTDFESLVNQTARQGYAFADGVFTPAICQAMQQEVAGLPLELGDHTKVPLNAGKSTEIKQRHERYYTDIASPEVPVARFVTQSLMRRAKLISYSHPVLTDWAPNEAGYQLYRQDSDMIGVHRDRRNDRLLAVTITIAGAARVLIHETIDDPNDYKNTKVVDEYETSSGSMMMLRAPGLGSGEQVLHQVLPPEQGDRLILNLRMRPEIDAHGTPKVLDNPASL